MPVTKKSPADLNSVAKPYGSKPSASVMAQTSDAIGALLADDVIAEFDRGIYWVDRTVSVNGGSTKQMNKMIYWNDTTFQAAGAIDNYTAVRSEGTGGDLDGLNDSSDNLPTGETTRVLLDVTNSNYSCYMGLLTLHCGGLRLAAIGATNRHKQSGAGGIGSVWDSLIVANGYWGMFGTPRYGEQRTYYAGAFVGNQWKRVRILNCKYPMLLSSNTGDDQHFGEINIINPAGGCSYLFGVNINCAAMYLGGHSDSDYCIDIQKASLSCSGSLYAEGDFATPLIVRDRGVIKGVLKYGGGGPTTFRDRAFVTAAGKTGGGQISCDPVTASGSDVEAVVAMKAVSGSARNWEVFAPFSEKEVKPFKLLGAGSNGDQLHSFFSEGPARWSGLDLARQAA